jgi:hypothetical protein
MNNNQEEISKESSQKFCKEKKINKSKQKLDPCDQQKAGEEHTPEQCCCEAEENHAMLSSSMGSKKWMVHRAFCVSRTYVRNKA